MPKKMPIKEVGPLGRSKIFPRGGLLLVESIDEQWQSRPRKQLQSAFD